MNIIRNESLIKRNARIGLFTTIGGIVVLIGGMYVAIQYPDKGIIYFGALLLGFLLSQIGMFFGNRYGRRPRPDELLDQGLRKLDNNHTLYHYSSPVSHLLLGPSGLWVLIPFQQSGTITFSKGRWRQKGGNLYLKIFAQEGLGRPDLEISGEVENLRRYLSKHFSSEEIPPIQSALVFTNPKVKIAISEEENPPAETVTLDKLKDVIRKSAKTKNLSSARVKDIQNLLNT